jgi:hypothetical protein
MLYELSTPFLNNHWFLDKLGMTGSRTQLVNGILLLATFALSRLVWGPYQTYWLYKDLWQAWNHVPPAFECRAAQAAAGTMNAMDLPLYCRTLPTWLAATYVAGTAVLTVLNFWWFNKMLAAVQKRFKPRKEEKVQADGTAKKEL